MNNKNHMPHNRHNYMYTNSLSLGIYICIIYNFYLKLYYVKFTNKSITELNHLRSAHTLPFSIIIFALIDLNQFAIIYFVPSIVASNIYLIINIAIAQR